MEAPLSLRYGGDEKKTGDGQTASLVTSWSRNTVYTAMPCIASSRAMLRGISGSSPAIAPR